jgi:drug/metabolite transporter (DMT)-like permease
VAIMHAIAGRRKDRGLRRVVARASLAPVTRAVLLRLLIPVVIFGAAFPVLKWGIAAGASPVWLAAWRAVLCLVVTLAVLAAMRRLAWPGRADLAAIVAIGVFQIAGFFVLLHAALLVVPAGTSAVLSYTTGLWLVPISVLFLGEQVTRRRLAAVLLGLGGILAIANPWALDWSSPGLLAGHALLLLAALSWAVAIAMLRVARPRLSTLQLLPFAFALASLLLLALALWREPSGGLGDGHAPLLALAFVGILGPLATWAASELSRQLAAVVSGTAFLGVPVLGLLLSVLLLGEPMPPALLAGAAMVIAGVALAVRSG